MKFHLFLQYGLHDDAVSNFPYAFLWIHQLPGCTQVLSEFCWMHHSHNFSKFCRAWQEQSMSPISYEHSWWFLWIPYPPGQWNRFLAIFVHSPDGAFHSTTFASPSAWHSFPLFSRFLAINDLAWMSAVFSLSLPGPHISVRRFFFQ